MEGEKKPSVLRRGWGRFWAFFGVSTKTHKAGKKRRKLVGDILTYLFLIAGAFVMTYPFWWMIAGSFTFTGITGTGQQILNEMVWWPSVSTFDSNQFNQLGGFRNYEILFSSAFGRISSGFSFWRALLNNLLYSVIPVAVGVLSSASSAYAFAKIEWVGRGFVFYFLLSAIMIPGPSIMSAQYVMYSDLNWRVNGLVMIIPGLFGSIMTAFFIRQFLFGLPTSILEAAKIDGAGHFRTFVEFILPLALPAIMAQAILSFMGAWNNYMGSFIMIPRTSSAINLPHAIALLDNDGQGAYANDYGVIIAGSVVCVLPVTVLFGCFQKLIIGSIMLTGSKE